jgi:hypothetical protein
MKPYQQTIIEILRWLAVLPSAFLAYIITVTLVDWGVSRTAYPELAQEVVGSYGFGGHYILGPLYIFVRFGMATFAGVGAAMKVAPSHKIKVGFVLFGIYILLIFISVFLFGKYSSQINWSVECVSRLVVELLAQLLGILGAIQTIRKEEMKIRGEELNFENEWGGE